MQSLRLPRRVEDDPEAERLLGQLAAHSRPLWAGGSLKAPRIKIGPDLEDALVSAYSAGRLIRGLEGAERALATEERGLRAVDRRTGIERGGRVSRVLLLSDDGSERFYREVESLVQRHAPRILALRSSVDEATLGRLFGADQVARLLLIGHKDAVSAVLLALARQWRAER